MEISESNISRQGTHGDSLFKGFLNNKKGPKGKVVLLIQFIAVGEKTPKKEFGKVPQIFIQPEPERKGERSSLIEQKTKTEGKREYKGSRPALRLKNCEDRVPRSGSQDKKTGKNREGGNLGGVLLNSLQDKCVPAWTLTGCRRFLGLGTSERLGGGEIACGEKGEGAQQKNGGTAREGAEGRQSGLIAGGGDVERKPDFEGKKGQNAEGGREGALTWGPVNKG